MKNELSQFVASAIRDISLDEIYIRLGVVHLSDQSPLTFECSIPNCLKEEITDYVTKKKKDLISKEVVEVTIDQDVIFNVVCKMQVFASFCIFVMPPPL